LHGVGDVGLGVGEGSSEQYKTVQNKNDAAAKNAAYLIPEIRLHRDIHNVLRRLIFARGCSKILPLKLNSKVLNTNFLGHTIS